MNLVLHGLAGLIAALAPSQGTLTLDEALRIAERNAFAVRSAESRVEQNRQRVAEARGNMGARVSAGATYTRFGEENRVQFGEGESIVVQPIQTGTAQFSLSMPIDIAGHLRRLVDASRANLRASQENLEATQNDVRLQTKRAFFNVLRAQSFVGVQEQSLRDADERLAVARRRFEAGDLARVEVIRFETQVSQAQTNLIAAQNTLEVTKQVFNQVLARPIETPVNLVEIADLPPVQMTADALVEVGEARRPEVQSLQHTLTALSHFTKAQEASLNPSLSLSLNHQRALGDAGFTSSTATTTGVLALNIPIFDSGVTRARVKQARQDEIQAKIQLQQLRLGISQEVRTALTNLENAAARLQTARQQVEFAEEVFRLAKVRQDAGEGTYVEVIDAETQLTTARNAQVAARYDYLTAYSELQRAIGSDSLTAPELKEGK